MNLTSQHRLILTSVYEIGISRINFVSISTDYESYSRFCVRSQDELRYANIHGTLGTQMMQVQRGQTYLSIRTAHWEINNR
jgi:hypothetical protein